MNNPNTSTDSSYEQAKHNKKSKIVSIIGGLAALGMVLGPIKGYYEGHIDKGPKAYDPSEEDFQYDILVQPGDTLDSIVRQHIFRLNPNDEDYWKVDVRPYTQLLGKDIAAADLDVGNRFRFVVVEENDGSKSVHYVGAPDEFNPDIPTISSSGLTKS